MKRYTVSASAVLALLMFPLPGAAADGVPSMPATRVSVLEMTPQAVMLTEEMAGRTVSYRKAEVRPQVRGIVRELSFKEGSSVEEGQILYQLESDMYQAQFDSAKAALDKAENNMNVARTKLNRTDSLYKSNSVSKQDWEDSRSSFLQAQADVAAAKASLRVAEINLDRTQIRAPIKGRIGKSSVTVGALVTADQATPLTTIYQINPMNVDLSQSADALRALGGQTGATGRTNGNMGMPQLRAHLVLSDGSDYAETGVVRFADVTVDEGTGTVNIRAEFPNPYLELLPGLYVKAIIELGELKDALSVPQRVVLRDAMGNPYVFVVKDGKAERRMIKLGRASGKSWLVLEGLAAGDRVIVDGLSRVGNGAPVQIVAEPGKPEAAAQDGGK